MEEPHIYLYELLKHSKEEDKSCFFWIGRVASYLHVVHDDLEEPSQGAAFLLDTRIHFSTGSEKLSTSQSVNFYLRQKPASRQVRQQSNIGLNRRL